jgi:hypothetical protein
MIYIPVMQLYHNSSSLAFDPNIDLTYGKYYPAKICASSSFDLADDVPVRIFCEVYGVFGNLSKRFADRLDNFRVECPPNGALKENFLLDTFPLEALFSIAEEPGFWLDVPVYDWKWPLFEELYKMCKGNLYLLEDWEGGEQLTDRYVWAKKTFGNTVVENMFWTEDKNRALLVSSKRDILIDSDLSNGEAWIKNGGSFVWFPELHWESPDKVRILSRRLSIIRSVVKSLE